MCTGKKQFSSRPLGQGKTNSFWRKKTHRMSGWRRPDENEDKGWTGIGMSYSQDGSKNKNPKPSTRERPCKVHWTQAWGEERPSRPHHVLWNWPSSSLPWTICPTPKLQNRQEILEQSCRSARMLSKPTSPAHTHSTCVRPFGCSCHVTPEFVLSLPLYNSVPCRSYKHRKASKCKLTVPAKNALVDTAQKTGQHCAKTGHHAWLEGTCGERIGNHET